MDIWRQFRFIVIISALVLACLLMGPVSVFYFFFLVLLLVFLDDFRYLIIVAIQSLSEL